MNSENKTSSKCTTGLCFYGRGTHREMNAARIPNNWQSLTQRVYNSENLQPWMCALTFPILSLQGEVCLSDMKLRDQSRFQFWSSLSHLCFHRRANGCIVGLSGPNQAHTVLVSECRGAAQRCVLPGRAGCVGAAETWPACMPTAHWRLAEGTGAPAAVQAGMRASWTWEKFFIQCEWIQCQNQGGRNGAWNQTAEAGERGRATWTIWNVWDCFEKCL